MISAFGVDHGEVSKAMSPNKFAGLTRASEAWSKGADPLARSKSLYAKNTLYAHEAGSDARRFMGSDFSAVREGGQKMIQSGKWQKAARANPEKRLRRAAFDRRMKRRRKAPGESPHDVIGKAHTDAQRRDHYGRMSTAMGATGALTGGVGVGARVIGHLEDKGHDPMGFTIRRRGKYADPHYGPEMKHAILDMNAKAHRGQAKILGATALMAGGLAAGYHYKKKKLQRVTKRRSKADVAGGVALGAGSATVAGLTLKNGMTANHFMGDDANDAIKQGYAGHQIVQDHKHGYKVTPKQLERAKTMRRLGARVGPIKQLGAKGAAAAAVTSGAGLYELGRYSMHRSKKAKS